MYIVNSVAVDSQSIAPGFFCNMPDARSYCSYFLSREVTTVDATESSKVGTVDLQSIVKACLHMLLICTVDLDVVDSQSIANG